MGVTDAQAMVGRGNVWSPVAPGTAQRLTEERGEVPPVPVTDAAGEERGELRVSEQPSAKAVDGSDKSGPPADLLVDADRLRFGGGGGGGVGTGGHGHGKSPR